MTPLTPEQVAELARHAAFMSDPTSLALSLEHERAERLAKENDRLVRLNVSLIDQCKANPQGDATIWRLLREKLRVESPTHHGNRWWLGTPVQVGPVPATVDEAADRLIAEQEAHDE